MLVEAPARKISRELPRKSVTIVDEMSTRTQSILSALRLIWDLLGRARIALIAGAVVVVALSALGVVHLTSRSSVNQQAEAAPSPGAAPGASAQATPTRRADEGKRVLAITDVKPKRKRLRDGSTQVAVTIGVAPVAEAKPGDVDIRVFFYDVTRDGQLRASNAQVAYAWLTPVRDWSDPAPKFLEAIYRRPRRQRGDGERTRFGGFIVQVYSDNQLQDELGRPQQILAALRQNAPEAEPTQDPPGRSDDDIDEELEAIQPEETPTSNRAPAGPPLPQTPTAAPPSATSPPQSSANVPLGKPAPNKPGFIYSPHDERFIIDVRGMPSGMEIIDPNTGKPLRVP